MATSSSVASVPMTGRPTSDPGNRPAAKARMATVRAVATAAKAMRATLQTPDRHLNRTDSPMRQFAPGPLRETSEPRGAGPDLGPLPEWRLEDLYAADDDPKLAADLDWLDAKTTGFAAKYEGRLAALDGDAMAGCVAEYERISQVMGRIMSYAGLRHAQNTTDPTRAKFLSDMQTRITDISAPLVFFPLEFNRVPDETLDLWYGESGALARYRPWVRR